MAGSTSPSARALRGGPYVSEVHCKRARAAQTLGAGVIHLDEAAFMQRPRHMLEADVVLHKVDGDIDLLKMVKARPISCLKGKTLPGDHPEAACAAHANAASSDLWKAAVMHSLAGLALPEV